MTRLTTSEITEGLKNLPGWQIKGSAIVKTYGLDNFVDAIAFVDKVADLAERAAHHPDILIEYSHVTLTLSTHSEGGITQKDLDLAKGIEGIK